MIRTLYPALLAAILVPVPLALLASPPAGGGSRVFDYPIHQQTLPNGLKVVVVPFESPGLVAHWVIVRVGSRNEIEPGHSGFAHFFEHMMFRGTEKIPADRYNSILKEMGADSNAFTSDDLTAYHILAGSDALPRIMEIESDRFMNLRYGKEAFQKEARAVLGEYNKNFSFPESTIEEKLYDAAFRTHTYKHTTIGFLRDIEDMPNQYDYSLTFYDRYYRPEHCILLVVGDVDPEKTFALAAQHYGPWKRGSYEVKIPAEPPQTAEKKVSIAWKNPTLPYLTLGYHSPAFSPRDKDMPALDLITQVAFSETSPLYKKLVIDEQLVDALYGSASDHRDPNLFVIGARVKDEAKIKEVQAAIEATLEDLKKNPVDARRLSDTKSHLKYAFQMRLNTADSVAETLAHILQLTGDPEDYNTLYATYDSLTPEDIQKAAVRYFSPENRTVVLLAAEKGKPKEVGR
ncbi:MAG TPA: pitrilysin family protein [Candidatus Polarisedimenticolia bacterium]|nr:pitrilysin family protein [Candidatus Polarisedimenticolia bacterium]